MQGKSWRVWGTRVVAACLLAGLTGCGDKPAAPAAQAAPEPLSPALQDVFARSCANCHANPATGAPQAGDRAAWAPRVAQGRELLLDHTINGYNGMPPMGTCMDCTREQYLALIEHMAATKLEH